MFQEAAEPKGGTFLIFLIAGHFDSSKLTDLEGSREVCEIFITVGVGRALGMGCAAGQSTTMGRPTSALH